MSAIMEADEAGTKATSTRQQKCPVAHAMEVETVQN
jgi:hypothetical protein